MALEMRDRRERCGGALSPSGEAYICSHECSFCRARSDVLQATFLTCGGELARRPRRASGG